ncbi:MAG: cyclic nucleotide-binding domain-containing protein [Acidimicrobiales bacterium]|nr:cyclic nucleotide-binding domain-containing protein [Acidimicrobiales bacterium]
MIDFRLRTNQHLGRLREMELFSDCSRAELSRIGSLTTATRVEQGSVLAREGSRGLEFFVIAEGTATASRHGLWLASFGPGSFFGEVALLDRSCRTATVVADTVMSVLVLSRVEFNSLLDSVPSVAQKILAEMGLRLRHTGALVAEVSSLGPSRSAVSVGAANSGVAPRQTPVVAEVFRHVGAESASR